MASKTVPASKSTQTRQFQNCRETVLKLLCFSFIFVCGQFKKSGMGTDSFKILGEGDFDSVFLPQKYAIKGVTETVVFMFQVRQI